MDLRKLIAPLDVRAVVGDLGRDILGIAYDSRKVKPGCLFVALVGGQADGHHFANEAAEKGAVAILVERPVEVPKATVIEVPSTRDALADVASIFHEYPARDLRLVGVTGTNGKTTSTFLLKHICEKALMRCGLIGTVRYEIGERIVPGVRTTPESLDLQELLFQIRAAGCRATAMEVSSHALALDRVRGIEFDVGVFTNLTQDHLDYHGSMEKYFEAKALLFSKLVSQKHKRGKAVINIDDRHGAMLVARFGRSLPVIAYGVGARADLRAADQRIDWSGTTFRLETKDRSFLVRLPLYGRFNVYNALAAIGAATALGIEARTAVTSLADAPSVPGRLEMVPVKRPYKVFIDYAHTPDALVNVLKTLRELGPRRLVVVFGCGGNRDKAKRPLMAAAVEEGADRAIITSDNPRKESPQAIIEDIRKGMRGRNYEVIEDRKEAIFRAIAMAEPRDVILIAGKGHETYQEFADHTVPFDDLKEARWAMEERAVETEG